MPEAKSLKEARNRILVSIGSTTKTTQILLETDENLNKAKKIFDELMEKYGEKHG